MKPPTLGEFQISALCQDGDFFPEMPNSILKFHCVSIALVRDQIHVLTCEYVVLPVTVRIRQDTYDATFRQTQKYGVVGGIIGGVISRNPDIS